MRVRKEPNMNTLKYLSTIISILLNQPEANDILDKHGLGPEITFGQIGIDDYTEFTRLYGLLNRIKEIKTTPIKEVGNGRGYDFAVTAPITIRFFHWK